MWGIFKDSSSQLDTAQQRLGQELRRGGIRDKRVIEAMERTPREAFVPSHLRHLAYEDMPLSIGYGQTISQPLIVAMMLEALDLKGDEEVLEVGAGSGYEAVLLSQLARRVVTVERISELTQGVAELTKMLGCVNVWVEQADETLGCPEYAPYDAIVVSAGLPQIPQVLLGQLKTEGRMVLPVGSREEQDLKWVLKQELGLKIRSMGPCRFVPVIGEGAWQE